MDAGANPPEIDGLSHLGPTRIRPVLAGWSTLLWARPKKSEEIKICNVYYKQGVRMRLGTRQGRQEGEGAGARVRERRAIGLYNQVAHAKDARSKEMLRVLTPSLLQHDILPRATGCTR